MKGLSNNQLKLIALVTMTLDHIGMILYPWVTWYRIVGRLAFPIFAFMIAEGCRHTRSMGKYLGTMALLALGCQIVDYLEQGSLYQSVLVTFSLSIGLIWLLQMAEKKRNVLWIALGALGFVGVYCFCEVLPGILSETDFHVDYGFLGVLVPVAVYLGKDKWQKMLLATLALCVLAYHLAGVQWYCLLAVPVLMLYNGKRGKWNMKWLFYIYYPAHLAVIYGISYLL